MWSDLIYTPSFLTTTWSTKTLAHFEFISDANPDYAAVTFWKNTKFVARSVHISAPDTHSYQFELDGLKNSVSTFAAQLLAYPPASIAVILTCDNQATVKHINCGARQFAQNQTSFQLIYFFARHEIRFIARWKHRSTAQISEVDSAGHLPTIAHFLANESFFDFLRTEFPSRSFAFFLRSHHHFLRILSHFSEFWSKFCSWNFSTCVPIIGPIFDNNILTFIVQKLLSLNHPVLFLVPKFDNCMFYQSLIFHCRHVSVPFSLVSELFHPGLLRYPLEVHFYDPPS